MLVVNIMVSAEVEDTYDIAALKTKLATFKAANPEFKIQLQVTEQKEIT